jgi:hypothetical protein
MTGAGNKRVHRQRCSGTVEDHRGLAFDVRDRALRNSGLLDLPPGYVLRNAIAWPWIKQIRTVWGNAIEFTLGNGRTEHVNLVSVSAGSRAHVCAWNAHAARSASVSCTIST